MALARKHLLVYCIAAAMMQLVPRVCLAARQPLTIAIAGQPRDYILITANDLPPGASPGAGSARPPWHRRQCLGAGLAPSPLTAWLKIADREKIYVVALQGKKGPDKRTGWHDCRSDDANDTDADDVGFAAAVVQSLIADGRVDPHRIYVMGMSNGAMMSYRLALEMRPAPAAIAAVSGTMALHSDCAAPTHPASVLIIHGTDDPVVPYSGGSVGFRRGKTSAVIGVEATQDFWLHVDGLQRVVPAINAFPHIGAGHTSAVGATALTAVLRSNC